MWALRKIHINMDRRGEVCYFQNLYFEKYEVENRPISGYSLKYASERSFHNQHLGDLCVDGGYELNSSGQASDPINTAVDFRGSRKGEWALHLPCSHQFIRDSDPWGWFSVVLCMCEVQKAEDETVLLSRYLVMFINLNFRVIFKNVYDLYAFYNNGFYPRGKRRCM
jgi:hypothetical protein